VLHIYFVMRDESPECTDVVAIQASQQDLYDQDFLAMMEETFGPEGERLCDMMQQKFIEFVTVNADPRKSYVFRNGTSAFKIIDQKDYLN
jgi:hypothetical protein